MLRLQPLLLSVLLYLLILFIPGTNILQAYEAPDIDIPLRDIRGIVIFGDSISDNGNTWRLTYFYNGLPDPLGENYDNNGYREYIGGPLSWLVTHLGPSIIPFPRFPREPYDKGYFSNGPVAVEYVADYLALNKSDPREYTNLAFGASWTSGFVDNLLHSLNKGQWPKLRLLFQGKILPPNLSHVLSVYLSRHPVLDPDVVYAIYFSGNDYVNGFSDPMTVVETQFNAIRQLLEHGARNIFWGLLPDLYLAPCFREHKRAQEVTSWAHQHNRYARRLGIALRRGWPDVKFTLIDVGGIFRHIANNPEDHGMTNTHDPCTNVYIPGCDVDPGMVSIFETPKASICQTPDTYIFWDQVHPTTRMHKICAIYICRLFNQAGYKVNCPDTMP